MRMNPELEKYRVRSGLFKTEESEDFGLFFIPQDKQFLPPLKAMCAPLDDKEWLHVSVSLPNRCPTWSEMSKIKKLFFGEDSCAVQYHPAKKDYVNNHPYCLHLWVRVGEDIPMPPSIKVGIKELGEIKL
jgi:hypothetical protein